MAKYTEHKIMSLGDEVSGIAITLTKKTGENDKLTISLGYNAVDGNVWELDSEEQGSLCNLLSEYEESFSFFLDEN